MNMGRAIPKWLLLPGLVVLMLSLLTGTLVYAARHQPADDQRCLKITPTSGDFSYVYFDVSSGTRLNMPQYDIVGWNEQPIQEIVSPDGSVAAVVIDSTTLFTKAVGLINLTNGTRMMRDIGQLDYVSTIWSSDSKYLAVAVRGPKDNSNEVVVLSRHDLTDVLRLELAGDIVGGAWAAHSNRLAIIEKRSAASIWLSILRVTAPDGSFRQSSIRLPDSSRSDLYIQWSPDDDYISVNSLEYVGVAASEGGEFQMISRKIWNETWVADTTTLAYIEKEADESGALRSYDPRTGASKLLSSDVHFAVHSFSPNGRLALLIRFRSSTVSTYSIMDLSTGVEASLGVSASRQMPLDVHWSADNKSVVVATSDKVLWADLRDPLHPIVHVSPLERSRTATTMFDNSWIRLKPFTQDSSSSLPQFHYLNLQTGDLYIWEQTNSPKDVYYYYWPDDYFKNMGLDTQRGAIRRVISDHPLITVDLENGPVPWLANTRYMLSIVDSAMATANSTVLLRRMDGTVLWAIQTVGNLQNVRWINCQTLR